ncbi:unnamed protein product [Toxocara canis]|uniref:Uncharacterized protein n=1 Tax=Toxocara canis TaxID=6265 RepID=A0A183TXC1_TOXCA|nr:unnamed protein product [Toxocara canis]
MLCLVHLRWCESLERGFVVFALVGRDLLCAFYQIACGVGFFAIMADVLRRTRGSRPDLGRTTRGRRDGGSSGDVGGCGVGGGSGDGGGFVDGGGFGTVAAVVVVQGAATPEVDLFLEEQR